MNLQPKKKRIVMLIAVAIIFLVGIGYLQLSSNRLKTSKYNELSGISKNSKTQSDNKILPTACQNAINDYPQWTKANTDIIIWENPDKSFNFRNSPEDLSSRVTSPIPPTEMLADMDFIGQNEISYVTIKDNNWKIGISKLNWPNPPNNSQIYEKIEPFSSVYTSPISRNEYIVLIINKNKGVLKYLNTNSSKEEIIFEIPSIDTEKVKLAVSPKGSYVYLLQNNSLILFEIASKKQISKINFSQSAVWIGNSDILYSTTEGIFIYDLKTKEDNQLNQLKQVTELTFNPKEDGIIAFNEEGNTKIVSCQNWQIINTRPGAEFKTLTSEKTAITKKGDQFGYWRFKDNDWGVKILEEKSKFVTVWKRY